MQYLSHTFSGFPFLEQSKKRKHSRTQDCKQSWGLSFAFSPMIHVQLLCCRTKRTKYLLPVFCWFVFQGNPFQQFREGLMQVPIFLFPFSSSPPNCDKTQPASGVIHVTVMEGPSTGQLSAKGAEGWDCQSPLGGL